MKALHYNAFCLFAAALISACTFFGTPTPRTYSERLAAGYTTVIQVRDSARILLTSGVITADDAQHIQAVADQARAGLDLARTFGQTPRGEDKLASTLIILTELQAYLAKRTPK